MPIPGNLRLAKGPVAIAAVRGFVDFIIHEKISQDFLKWISETRHPDESYFNTLNFNPQLGAPGAFTGDDMIEPLYSCHL